MVRESGISATKPIFPSYLLPSIRLPFQRRRSSSSTAASSTSPTSTVETTPENSPPTPQHLSEPRGKRRSAGHRLSRSAPDTLRCATCSSDIALASQIVSKGFTGRHGRAFLVAPPQPAPQVAGPDSAASSSLLNVRIGKTENRQLVTGWHVVADISCSTCSVNLGWKYVDAKEQAQKYKVGKYILETERVITHRRWEDGDVEELSDLEEDDGVVANDVTHVNGSAGENRNRAGSGDSASESDVVFDSEDEDECEDIFAGTWDAETVAKRRSRMVTRHRANGQ